MPEHAIPERLLSFVMADLRSRIAEHGPGKIEKVNEAVSILRALPTISERTELEITWSAEDGHPFGASFRISDRNLSLSIEDQDGTQEIYDCDAGWHPRIDHEDFEAWIRHLRSIGAPDIAISVWMPEKQDEPEELAAHRDREIQLAAVRHANFYSAVSLQLKPGGSMRMLVYDTGVAPNAAFGSDYDRWVDIADDAKEALILALLEDRYSGDTNAVNNFRAFCEAKGVPHNYDVY